MLRAFKDVEKNRIIDQNEWERARTIAVVIARSNGAKIKPDDIIKLKNEKPIKNNDQPEFFKNWINGLRSRQTSNINTDQ